MRSLVAATLLLALAAPGCTKKDRPAGIAADPAAAAAAAASPVAAPRKVPTVDIPADPPPPPVDLKTAISGKLTLPAARRGDVGMGDTIFIVAKRPDAKGEPVGPPIAVKRMEAASFPLPFVLTAADAMMPGMPWDGVFTLTVRVDKDGNASSKLKGDVTGIARNVKIGAQDLSIALDTLQTQDLPSVGGPAPMGAPMGGADPHGAGSAHGAGGAHGTMPAGHP